MFFVLPDVFGVISGRGEEGEEGDEGGDNDGHRVQDAGKSCQRAIEGEAIGLTGPWSKA